jgi:predicted kinase
MAAVFPCRQWFAISRSNCSAPGICVTSLNMRKWMRERLQRRKKKADEQEAQPAPPPLQPAYFEGEPTAETATELSRDEERPAREMTVEAESRDQSMPNGETRSGEAAQTRAATSGGARRGRRRRGGRGRGGRGRGREEAVARAFTPTAGKGTVPEARTQADEEPGFTKAQPTDAEGEAGVGTQAEREVAAASPQVPRTAVAVPAAPPRPPKGLVVLAIGLPGSGKSSWFKRHKVTPLSSDMVRALLFDDVREQRYQDLVFSNLRSMLKARLIAKRPMNYVDATNLTPQERQHWIKLAKDYNYEVHAVFFDVPLEVCIERHQRRDRVVPEDAMRRMAAKLKPPSFDEGFAKITVVRVKKKEQESA